MQSWEEVASEEFDPVAVKNLFVAEAEAALKIATVVGKTVGQKAITKGLNNTKWPWDSNIAV